MRHFSAISCCAVTCGFGALLALACGGASTLHAADAVNKDAVKKDVKPIDPSHAKALAAAERAAIIKQKMLDRFDADHDGKLSQTERIAARQAKKQGDTAPNHNGVAANGNAANGGGGNGAGPGMGGNGMQGPGGMGMGGNGMGMQGMGGNGMGGNGMGGNGMGMGGPGMGGMGMGGNGMGMNGMGGGPMMGGGGPMMGGGMGGHHMGHRGR